jgi:hypothetical protein
MDRMLSAFFPDGARALSTHLPSIWERISVCHVPFVEAPGMLLFSDSSLITFPAVIVFACGGFTIGLYGA